MNKLDIQIKQLNSLKPKIQNIKMTKIKLLIRYKYNFKIFKTKQNKIQ